MEIMLYDHRLDNSICDFRSARSLGKTKKFRINMEGYLNIDNTDLLYSIRIELSKHELDILRGRLNEIHDRLQKRKRRD